MMNSVIKILIADDQAIVRQGLIALLSLDKGIEIVAEAENGQRAIELAHQFQPDVVLMDVRMPICDGIEATRILTQKNICKVLMLTTFDDNALLSKSMEAGASGYLLKDSEAEQLSIAIRSVCHGMTLFGPSVGRKVSDALHHRDNIQETKEAAPAQLQIGNLTARELEVLSLIGTGKSNKEIGTQLHISEGTVKGYVSRILAQLGCRDRTQAALLARQAKI